MGEFGRIPVSKKFTLKEKVLVGGRMFRLLAGDVVGLVADAMTQTDINEDGVGETDIIDRAELRTGAIAVNISRFQLEREIGPEEHRQQVERAFREEFSLD